MQQDPAGAQRAAPEALGGAGDPEVKRRDAKCRRVPGAAHGATISPVVDAGRATQATLVVRANPARPALTRGLALVYYRLTPDNRGLMYKRAAVLAVALVIVARPASAQWTLGLVAGGTSASTSSDGLGRSPISPVTGFTGGLSLTVPLTRNVSFAPEILYAMKGTTDKLSTAGTDVIPQETGTSKIGYIEVPILVRISFGSGSLRPFVTAGPEVAFRMSCSFAISGTDPFFNGTSKCSQDTYVVESGVKSTDMGALVGLGLSSGRVSVSVRYDLSLTNSSSDIYGAYSKNRAIMAVVGITP